MKKNTLINLLIVGAIIALPVVCLAAGDLQGKLKDITDTIVKVGTGVVLLMVVVAGILFATSAGDTSKVTTAKAALFWAIIGGGVIAIYDVLATLIK